MRVELSESFGKVLLATAKIKGELFMTDPADGVLRLFANGFRVTRETAEGTRLFSFFKPQPSALIIEADDPHLDFMSDGEIEQLDDGDTIVATTGQQRLVIVVNWKRAPVRMAALSGTGEPAQLAARARTLLNSSAHLALDELQRSAGNQNDEATSIDPLAYLMGRLRPASTVWPGIWLANRDEQPLFSMESQLLLAHALSATGSTLLPAMIHAALEACTIHAQDGRLLAQMARLPLLLQTMEHFPAQQERWHAAVTAHAAGIEAYLDEAGKPLSYVSGAASPLTAKLRPWLWRRERQAWKWLADKAGLLASGAMPTAPATNPDDPPWLCLLDEQRGTALPADAIEEALASLATSVEEASEDAPVYWAVALLLTDSSNLLARPALRHAFRQRLLQAAEARWRSSASSMREAGLITYDDTTLALAAVAVWARFSPPEDPAVEGKASRAMLWRLSNRRRRLIGIGAVIIALFVGWLISVQFRRSLPTSAFETRLGMIQHHYQTGAFDVALDKLDELENIRALSPGILNLWRGKIFYRQGNYASAEQSFAEAAESLEANPAPLFNRALSQFKQRKYREAVASFEDLAATFQTTHPATAARALRAAAICEDLAKPAGL